MVAKYWLNSYFAISKQTYIFKKKAGLKSIFIGFLTKDMIVGVGSDFFGVAIYNNPKTLHIFDAEFVEFFYKTLPVALSLTGASLSFILYNFQPSILFNLNASKVLP